MTVRVSGCVVLDVRAPCAGRAFGSICTGRQVELGRTGHASLEETGVCVVLGVEGFDPRARFLKAAQGCGGITQSADTRPGEGPGDMGLRTSPGKSQNFGPWFTYPTSG